MKKINTLIWLSTAHLSVFILTSSTIDGTEYKSPASTTIIPYVIKRIQQ